jgi:hypothetical protein
MRWVRHVALIREVRNSGKILVGNLKETEYLGDVDIYEEKRFKIDLRRFVEDCVDFIQGCRFHSSESDRDQ